MRIIAVTNQKGGCGKTTAAVNLSAVLAARGRRVLLVDLDPQAHATVALGLSPADCPATIDDVLRRNLPLRQAIRHDHLPGLDVIASSIPLAAAEQALSGSPGKERRLLESLRSITKRYDYVLVDSPPSLGLLTFNALRAADEAIVPIDPSFLSIHGLGRLLEMADLLRSEGRHSLSLKALLVMFDLRTRFARRVLTHLESAMRGRYQTIIRQTVRLREAAACGKPVIAHAPRCSAVEDFEYLADEVIAEEPSAMGICPGQEEPCQTEGGVFFWRPRRDGEEVTLAGDFNEWVPDRQVVSIPEAERTIKFVRLSPGRYRYRWVVDGIWVEDSSNLNRVPSTVEGFDSVCEVEERPQLAYVA
jgi:chromosome partitioning protein